MSNNPEVKITNVVMVKTSELIPNPRNPNFHPPEQIERLAQIIEHQGWRRPITVSNQSGFMTVGHGRLDAAKLRGWAEAPVTYQDYDNEAAEYADMVADNALNEWSELDLSRINSVLGDLGPDFDIDLLGIKDFTIDVAEHDLDDKQNKPDDGRKHFLEVELSSEKEMVEVYEDLLSRGLIVRYK